MIDDDAAANTGAQGDSNGVVSTFQSTCHVLAVCRCIGVIFHKDLLAFHALGQHLLHGSVFKRQVVGKLNNASLLVDGARRANTNPRHIVNGDACVLQSLISGSRHSVSNFLGIGNLGLGSGPRDNFVFLIYDTYGNIGAAQIDSEIIHTELLLPQKIQGSSPII